MRSRSSQATRRISLVIQLDRTARAAVVNHRQHFSSMYAARCSPGSGARQESQPAKRGVRLRARGARRIAFLKHPRQQRAQDAHHRFDALRVPAQPEQIVGHAAGQIESRAADFERMRGRPQQAELRRRPVAQHPSVLAAAAALHGDHHVARAMPRCASALPASPSRLARGSPRKRASPDAAAAASAPPTPEPSTAPPAPAPRIAPGCARIFAMQFLRALRSAQLCAEDRISAACRETSA